MIGKLKALGLTLIVSLALGALGASAALAQNFHFTSDLASTSLAGSQVGTDVFVVDAGETSCAIVTYTGSMTGPTALAVGLTPFYNECQSKPIGSAIVHVETCSYRLTAKTKPNAEVHIVCTNLGDAITITARALGTIKCTIEIGPQTLTGVTVGAVAGGDITATMNINGISYSQTKGEGIGACTTKSNTNGSYTGHAVIDGGAASLGLANT